MGNGASTVIDVRVGRIEQLFESLDPSPFHERDLDPKAADYILGWAAEPPETGPITIRVQLPPDEARRPETADVASAVHTHFGYLARGAERELSTLLRLGRDYLVIGIAMLTVCLAASQLVRTQLGEGPFAAVLSESLIIVGWVANWKPIETFLYDWWPVRRRVLLLRRLASAEVLIQV